jgi:hypothetical protein
MPRNTIRATLTFGDLTRLARIVIDRTAASYDRIVHPEHAVFRREAEGYARFIAEHRQRQQTGFTCREFDLWGTCPQCHVPGPHLLGRLRQERAGRSVERECRWCATNWVETLTQDRRSGR